MGFIENLFSADMLGKLAAFLCAFLWAIAVILFKKSGETIRPLVLNLYKSAVSVILIIPVMILSGIQIVPQGLSSKEIVILLLSGILGIAVSDTLFFKALNLLGAGLTAIVDCFYSPVIILFSFIFLLNPVTVIEMIGGLMVITAILVATLRLKDRERSPRDLILGVLLGALAMITMGFSVTMMKPVLDKAPILWVTEIRLIAGTAALGLLIAINRDRRSMIASVLNRATWKYAFPATFIGSFLAMILWISAFKLTSVNSAAILNQTNTIFIVVFASIFLKEKFTLRRFSATLIGVAGSIIVLLG
jgi:drug/metabolite transporter (DMT)-like permease